MPIVTLPKRFPSIGAISAGHQKLSSGKEPVPIPTRTKTIVFHADRKDVLEVVAAAYGGEVQESPTSTEEHEKFFVVTTKRSIPFRLPVGDLEIACPQFMECWASSGLVRQCDGETTLLRRGEPKEVKDKRAEGGKRMIPGDIVREKVPCVCEADVLPEDKRCSPTVRLNLVAADILLDLPAGAFGVFIVRSTGFFTNVALRNDLELIASIMAGDLNSSVPLRLELEQTHSKHGDVPRFRVKLDVTLRDALALAVEAGGAVSLPAPRPELPEHQGPVGRYVDKNAKNADDTSGSEPGNAKAADPNGGSDSGPDVVDYLGHRVPFAKDHTPVEPTSPDASVAPQWAQINKRMVMLGWGVNNRDEVFELRYGFQHSPETPASKLTAQDFFDFLNSLELPMPAGAQP